MTKLLKACVLVLLLGPLAACHTAGRDVLRQVRPIAQAAEPREVAVAYRSLTGASAFVNEDLVVHAASTMKIAVLIEVLRASERGQLSLDEGIPVVNRFSSHVDGSPFALDPLSDSDPDLYAHLGQTLPVRELARRMIVRSSNLATNLLLRRVTPVSVQATIEAIGTRRMRVVRYLEDQKAYDAGISNVTTARDLSVLMLAIARGTAFLTEGTRHVAYAMLAAQELDDMIPAGLPRKTVVLHKTGDITRIRHDAAIVYPQGKHAVPYVLVVLTRGFEDPKEATAVIVDVSRAVYAEHTGRRGD
jgi:beta-lactamase class A